MADVTIIIFLTCFGLIFLLINFWMRQGSIAILGVLVWFIVAAYCIQNYYSGDPDFGAYTWAMIFVAIMAAIICGLTPNYLKNRYTEQNDDAKPQSRWAKRNERFKRQEENLEQIRSARPKRREPFL